MEVVKEILTAAGVPHRQGRFPSPPAETYAVYFDDIESDGADPITPPTRAGLPYIQHHEVSVELYEPRPDPSAEQAVEATLDAWGVMWSKEDRYWLQDVQRYQVIYTFFYTSKKQ